MNPIINMSKPLRVPLWLVLLLIIKMYFILKFRIIVDSNDWWLAFIKIYPKQFSMPFLYFVQRIVFHFFDKSSLFVYLCPSRYSLKVPDQTIKFWIVWYIRTGNSFLPEGFWGIKSYWTRIYKSLNYPIKDISCKVLEQQQQLFPFPEECCYWGSQFKYWPSRSLCLQVFH